MHVPHAYSASDLRKLAHLDEKAFAAQVGNAMLMVHGSTEAPARVARTGTHNLDDLRTGDTFIAFIPVLKSDRNQFGFISIGRTGNNDVVLVDVTLSKFHAFFRDENGAFSLLDAGSKNGTAVDGVQVPVRGAGAAVMLTKTCEVRFGSVSTTFLPLPSLRRFLGL